MAQEARYRGRIYTEQELGEIRDLIARNCDASRVVHFIYRVQHLLVSFRNHQFFDPLKSAALYVKLVTFPTQKWPKGGRARFLRTAERERTNVFLAIHHYWRL